MSKWQIQPAQGTAVHGSTVSPGHNSPGGVGEQPEDPARGILLKENSSLLPTLPRADEGLRDCGMVLQACGLSL